MTFSPLSELRHYELIITSCGSFIVQFLKKSKPTPWKVIAIPSGRLRGALEDKILEVKFEAKLEFPGGMGVQNKKTFRGGSMDIFWNLHILGPPTFVQ